MCSLFTFMPYKDYEKQKETVRLNYYKNREKRLAYQREYDKKHKGRKRKQDQKRRATTNKNKLRVIQNYSRKHYFAKLFKKYGGCQLCKSIDKLEIHHIKYTKKINDCLLLCQNCHKKIHRKV